MSFLRGVITGITSVLWIPFVALVELFERELPNLHRRIWGRDD